VAKAKATPAHDANKTPQADAAGRSFAHDVGAGRSEKDEVAGAGLGKPGPIEPTPSEATPREPTASEAGTKKPGMVRRVVLPPGYDAQAAKSTLRRYPRQIAAAMSSVAASLGKKLITGAPWMGHAFDEQLARMESAPLAAMWLGHATVLIRMDGRWVLTDPVLTEQIGVRLGVGKAAMTIGPRRLTPAIDPRRLPVPDVILLSHAHFDHLDRPTLQALANKKTQVVTARGTVRLVPRGFAMVHELPWEKSLDVAGLSLLAMQPQHWGARTMWDKHRGFNSYALSDKQTVLYAGDTAHTQAFGALAQRVAPVTGIDLSIFGIGAYDPWIAAHASPEQVWQMHTQSGAANLLPMHHSTFVLSDEPIEEPLQRLLRAAGSDVHRVVGTELGQAWIWDNSETDK
jgi:L-ascorbate metabolism protein UlaG (beta-lactamase superfamily)